ncbi:hypothetical protein B0H16DRAFT_1456147 [Mycena metata]|uniref:Uncharacterized protein n=1 Tax=Mycena metata TaxID=1033252 RepID=A0AAD7NHX1_9AGAR|nr:hypothetical protein B0H16DRAFT_1456147 [Mycena metata]
MLTKSSTYSRGPLPPPKAFLVHSSASLRIPRRRRSSLAPSCTWNALDFRAAFALALPKTRDVYGVRRLFVVRFMWVVSLRRPQATKTSVNFHEVNLVVMCPIITEPTISNFALDTQFGILIPMQNEILILPSTANPPPNATTHAEKFIWSRDSASLLVWFDHRVLLSMPICSCLLKQALKMICFIVLGRHVENNKSASCLKLKATAWSSLDDGAGTTQPDAIAHSCRLYPDTQVDCNRSPHMMPVVVQRERGEKMGKGGKGLQGALTATPRVLELESIAAVDLDIGVRRALRETARERIVAFFSPLLPLGRICCNSSSLVVVVKSLSLSASGVDGGEAPRGAVIPARVPWNTCRGLLPAGEPISFCSEPTRARESSGGGAGDGPAQAWRKTKRVRPGG